MRKSSPRARARGVFHSPRRSACPPIRRRRGVAPGDLVDRLGVRAREFGPSGCPQVGALDAPPLAGPGSKTPDQPKARRRCGSRSPRRSARTRRRRLVLVHPEELRGLRARATRRHLVVAPIRKVPPAREHAVALNQVPRVRVRRNYRLFGGLCFARRATHASASAPQPCAASNRSAHASRKKSPPVSFVILRMKRRVP